MPARRGRQRRLSECLGRGPSSNPRSAPRRAADAAAPRRSAPPPDASAAFPAPDHSCPRSPRRRPTPRGVGRRRCQDARLPAGAVRLRRAGRQRPRAGDEDFARVGSASRGVRRSLALVALRVAAGRRRFRVARPPFAEPRRQPPGSSPPPPSPAPPGSRSPLTIVVARVDGAGSHRRRYYGHVAEAAEKSQRRDPSAIIISDGPAEARTRSSRSSRTPPTRPVSVRRRSRVQRQNSIETIYGVAARDSALFSWRGPRSAPRCRAGVRGSARPESRSAGRGTPSRWQRSSGRLAVVCDARALR